MNSTFNNNNRSPFLRLAKAKRFTRQEEHLVRTSWLLPKELEEKLAKREDIALNRIFFRQFYDAKIEDGCLNHGLPKQKFIVVWLVHPETCFKHCEHVACSFRLAPKGGNLSNYVLITARM